VQYVAANGYRQPGEIVRGLAAPLERLTQRKRIKQRLRGMFMAAIAGIKHRAIDLIGQQLGRSARSVPYHDRIGAHRIQGDRRVDQRLALLEARCGGLHVDDIGPEPLAGYFEAQ